MSLKGEIIGYNKKVLAISAISIIGASLFFCLGATYEKYKLSSLGQICPNSFLSSKPENELRGFLTAKGEKNVTIRMEDGNLRNIECDENTTFGTSKKGTIDDLLIGQLLLITGRSDPNGTFVPQNIRKSNRSPKIIPPEIPKSQGDSTNSSAE